MPWKQWIPCLIKITFVLIFTLLLIYWSVPAFEKFINQQPTTFVTYTQGDDDVNVIYPLLTICGHYDIEKDSLLKECMGKALFFQDAIYNCLKSEPDFDLSKYMAELLPKVEDFVLESNSKLENTTYYYIVNLTNDYFTPFFDPIMLSGSQCITLDSTKLNLQAAGYIHSHVFLKFNSSSLGDSEKVALLHNELDWPDARWVHPKFIIEEHSWKVRIRKKIIKRQPTRNSPCGPWGRGTCIDIKKNQEIADRYHCKISILHRGKHLDQHVQSYANLPFCNNSVTVQALFQRFPQEDCYPPCERIKFEAQGMSSNDKDTFLMAFIDAEVEHYISFIGYDGQSLISELGGIIGMFLGLSGVPLAYNFANFIERTFIN